MRYSLQKKFRLFFIFFTGLQLSSFSGTAQQNEKEPQPELGWGIKVVTRQIQYDKNSRYITDPGSIGLQTGVRYDVPKKIGAGHYLALTGQAGFLFCKANVFDTTFRDPVTNKFIREHSHNPTYMPLYFGVYSRSAISLGTDVFYWKGLGARDIWGIRFLSLGYNGKQFRLSAAGELYAQVADGKNNGLLFTVDFCWKLITGRDAK